MGAQRCDKCGVKQTSPSRYHRTCNHPQPLANEPTGHCQGTLRPEGQFSAAGAWVAPGAGAQKDLEYNQ